jgi:hypothetical protein
MNPSPDDALIDQVLVGVARAIVRAQHRVLAVPTQGLGDARTDRDAWALAHDVARDHRSWKQILDFDVEIGAEIVDGVLARATEAMEHARKKSRQFVEGLADAVQSHEGSRVRT